MSQINMIWHKFAYRVKNAVGGFGDNIDTALAVAKDVREEVKEAKSSEPGSINKAVSEEEIKEFYGKLNSEVMNDDRIIALRAIEKHDPQLEEGVLWDAMRMQLLKAYLSEKLPTREEILTIKPPEVVLQEIKKLVCARGLCNMFAVTIPLSFPETEVNELQNWLRRDDPNYAAIFKTPHWPEANYPFADVKELIAFAFDSGILNSKEFPALYRAIAESKSDAAFRTQLNQHGPDILEHLQQYVDNSFKHGMKGPSL